MKLELRDITKRFGTLVANDRISADRRAGRDPRLLGENGAGKSTLMNVLYGLYRADEGEILLDDEVQHFTGPGDAIAAGIGMVHQHFMLIPVFTVAENVMLGNEATGFAGSLDLDAARKRVQEISQRFGFHVNPDSVIEDLPVGVQQRVEIIKALSRDAEVLVFDEPTAVLTPQETDELMGIMRQLKEAGKAIVFITHKLREVREVADQITVIRLGKVVGEAAPTASNKELAAMMVGRPVELTVHKDPPKLGEDALVVDKLRVIDALGHVHVDDLSFTIKRGEVLAVAGVQGNGQTELTEALLGPPGPRHGLDHARRQGAGRPLGAQDPRRRRRLRPRGPPGRRPGRQHDHRREPDAQPQLRRALRPQRLPAARQARRVREEEAQGVRRPRARHHHARPASSPAATSRRSSSPASSPATCGCSWPPSRPAASTSAPSSSSTPRSWPPATAAFPCWSSRPSSTRSLRSPTGSWCSTAAGSSGIVPPDTPREVLGLMMTGERPEGAVA